ncbi:hypothetical protein ABVK25_001530 [Lepraria finkii]|uniref:Uncharacterized protein n=1 Tax=Lepraria finkii TaxID=1340010 RepID=A0ABR4BJC8_9LECA
MSKISTTSPSATRKIVVVTAPFSRRKLDRCPSLLQGTSSSHRYQLPGGVKSSLDTHNISLPGANQRLQSVDHTPIADVQVQEIDLLMHEHGVTRGPDHC